MQTSFVTSRLNGSEWMESKGIKYAVYALIFGIILAIALIVADMFFPFLPVNPLGGPSATARNGKKFWDSSMSSAENLIVPSTLSPTINPNLYSMTVQIMIADSRTTPTNKGKFRHVLHRGSDPCQIAALATQAGPSGHSGIQASDVNDAIYTGDGLPNIMNPGILLDEYTNDLHILMHTTTGGSQPILTLEGCTVSDLPLKTPITLGIVCNANTVEVYVNCLLYQTILLKGTLYLPAGNNQWFGRYGVYPMAGLVQNLQLWSAALTSADYTQICRAPSFDTDKLPTCKA
jgi:hypothetical protein